MPHIRYIALVAPGLQYGGGVPAMTRFLAHTLRSVPGYAVGLFSLAMSARDENSLRFSRPSSWSGGVQTKLGKWHGLPVTFVGAMGAELESQRYQPRRVLNALLAPYDLVQVVAGTPAWALAASQISRPTCLYVATTAAQERVSLLRQMGSWRRRWYQLTTAWHTRVEPKALRHMNHVFALSPYTQALLFRHLPGGRLSLAPPGIDTALFHPATPYCAKGPIISVGRFNDPRKNFKLLLAAYRQVRQQLAAPPLLLVGTPPSPADWALAQQWGLVEHIQVVGEKTPTDLALLYREASLFALASDEEGLGIVVLEAMASGLPVVSTRNGGAETCLVDGETGFLTPVGDASALADRLCFLLARPTLRQQMGEAGRRLVAQQYALSVAGEPFLSVYDQLLSS